MGESRPYVLSIEPHHPTNHTHSVLVFNVTFSEAITNVNRTDFILNPHHNHTGERHSPKPYHAGSNQSIPLQFKQPEFAHVFVGQQFTVWNVTISLNITHPYKSDLIVRVFGPDDQHTLHNRTGWYHDDIHHTYHPDFAGTNSTGIWSILVEDQTYLDSGTWDRWSLTISPYPGVICEGVSCLVAVYPAGPGSYNLDIIPDNGIIDLDGNRLTGVDPAVDHTYVVE